MLRPGRAGMIGQDAQARADRQHGRQRRVARAMRDDAVLLVGAAHLESVAEADASGIPYFLVGHVGDGNFHFGYLIDPDKPEEREVAEALNHQLVHRALSLEGTCTGEHGIGLHKMDFLLTETGAGAVDMMRTIKRALDPKNIMNPGKIFSL